MLNLVVNHGLFISIEVVDVDLVGLTHPILLVTDLGTQRKYFLVKFFLLIFAYNANHAAVLIFLGILLVDE